MAAKTGKAAGVVEKATEAVDGVVDKLYRKGVSAVLPATDGKPGDTVHLSFQNALIAIAVGTFMIWFLQKLFLRTVYFQFKADQKDETPKFWSSTLHAPGFLTGIWKHKDEAEDDEDEDEDDDAASTASSPKKASPKKSSSPKSRARSSSPGKKSKSK